MKRKKLNLSAAVIMTIGVMFLLNSCTTMSKNMTSKTLVAEANKSIVTITVKDARALLGKTGVIFLDVREPKEFKAGHIPGSMNLPRGLVEFKIGKKIKDKNRKIVVYCKTAGRGALASLSLVRMDYTNVVNVAGGWKAWTKAGYPVE